MFGILLSLFSRFGEVRYKWFIIIISESVLQCTNDVASKPSEGWIKILNILLATISNSNIVWLIVHDIKKIFNTVPYPFGIQWG